MSVAVLSLQPAALLPSLLASTSISVFFPHGFWYWLIVGLIAGWLAGKIGRGRGFGCVADIILGVVGSYIGGWIFLKVGLFGGGFWYSLAAATVGAIVLVGIAHILFGPSEHH